MLENEPNPDITGHRNQTQREYRKMKRPKDREEQEKDHKKKAAKQVSFEILELL